MIRRSVKVGGMAESLLRPVGAARLRRAGGVTRATISWEFV
jgi:hypothetical protein